MRLVSANCFLTRLCGGLILVWLVSGAMAESAVEVRNVPGQPLGANVQRLVTALEYLGAPLPAETIAQLNDAAQARDARKLQELLDEHVLFVVSLNPEVRVKAARGPAEAVLQQAGFTPHIIKVINDSTVTRELRIESPQGGPVYAGAAEGILQRQAQTELKENENTQGATDRFLEVEMFHAQPLTRTLSGLQVEYALAMIYSSEAGKLEATIGFDVGAGTQDLGFRGEVPVLFDVRPAIPVKLHIRDHDGTPTAARLTFRDARGKVYPPQAKRLAPDFFFQPQIYRQDGGVVLLPPGEFTLTYSRGPEYRELRRQVTIPDEEPAELEIELQRWIDPQKYGYYCGDHHIHGAGCSHYDNPTQGVTPQDMFVQVKGEGLNVGCVLTWGPCFDFQRQFFSPVADTISEPFTVLKYDLEISGFGSAALGHVCLLNLKDQTYPGSEGTKTEGWPTWTVPVMRWAKEQGGVTGYPHSALYVNPPAAAARLVDQLDKNGDEVVDAEEAREALLPESIEDIDDDRNGTLSTRELQQSVDRVVDQLPNLAIPEMNGAGAMEIFVSTAEGVCDFTSAMDTARIPEWNTWYHLMNCGFPLKLSGETDFPCMSSRRVGQGRVYVHLGDETRLDFSDWCEGLRQGRSYVSDGYAHALSFTVDDHAPGDAAIEVDGPRKVTVRAKVAFAPELPQAVAYGTQTPGVGRRMVGDTVNLHAPRSDETLEGGSRLVELVMNGRVVAEQEVPADGQIHDLEWSIEIKRSSWIAVRQFPQLHTNPVTVLVGGRPIRASRESALWCAETIKLLWKNRHRFIAEAERPAAKAAYDRAVRKYQQIARDCVSTAHAFGQRNQSNARPPRDDADLKRWLENIVVYHDFSTDEVQSATGLDAERIADALHRFDIRRGSRPAREADAPLLVLPYPGGRHPRIGFLDGAIDPQRETKLSVFTPWDPSGYVVLDIPEAIWSNLGLTYLAHTHVPTIWSEEGIELERLEWERADDGGFVCRRTLPNGISFGTSVLPYRDHVQMEMWLTNGTDRELSDLRVQNCVLLKGAPGFEAQTNDNKTLWGAYVACRSEDGRRWIITAWDPLHRAWANPPCPCLHSDAKFPDCAPGRTERIRGWLSFYEGGDVQAELERIERTGWRHKPLPVADAGGPKSPRRPN